MAKKLEIYDGGTGQRTPNRPHPAGHILMPHPEKINVNAGAIPPNRGGGIGENLEDIEMGWAKEFDAKPKPGKWNLHDGASRPGVLSNRDPATGQKAGASMGTTDGMHRCNQGPMSQSGQRSSTIAAARIGHLSGGETHMRVPAARMDADVEPEYQPMGSHDVTGSAGDKTP